eukprot:TRINITY_DN8147_c0_g3_i3.p1 TRINITY_DN8147_c0_g3~~TRINITY_DN8147_c0_g3_i3.p1  ORF type:complete len:181 (-),score=14.45 TRINITY_DN8147_c0_g3_i3:144-686(-)
MVRIIYHGQPYYLWSGIGRRDESQHHGPHAIVWTLRRDESGQREVLTLYDDVARIGVLQFDDINQGFEEISEEDFMTQFLIFRKYSPSQTDGEAEGVQSPSELPTGGEAATTAVPSGDAVQLAATAAPSQFQGEPDADERHRGRKDLLFLAFIPLLAVGAVLLGFWYHRQRSLGGRPAPT